MSNKPVEVERRKPRTEFRQEALKRASEIACAHTNLSYPGEATLLWAGKFADFLENGTTEEPAQ